MSESLSVLIDGAKADLHTWMTLPARYTRGSIPSQVIHDIACAIVPEDNDRVLRMFLGNIGLASESIPCAGDPSVHELAKFVLQHYIEKILWTEYVDVGSGGTP